MFIDHAAVYVEDLERGACFYEQYFGGVRGERYENPRTGFSSYFITFDGGNTRLEVMHNDAIARPVDRGARGYAHVAVQRRLARARR
ncbi:VOC family protein [Bifidobacterium pseudolongum]|uniref:VOC family protein n=1 Tax=Bifidobacterium pseudolongum TaxID=1694 RepID=UPI001F1189CE|nr:VOC family protein [Bifidobacterium pseudolongum]MCH4855837.1 VOC family protein [Bifidobacterium pseudolongum]